VTATTEPGEMHHWPVVLDDDTVLFYRMRPGGMGVASLKTGEWKDLGPIGQPVGVANGMLLYRSLRDSNLMAVRWDAVNQEPIGASVVVPGIPSELSAVALAGDGTLVFVEAVNQYQVVLVDESGAADPIQPGEIVREIFPRFSPQGDVIAIGADFRGISELWLYDLPRSTLSALNIGFDPHTVEWTTDGGRLLAAPPQVTDIWSKPANASEEATTIATIPEAIRGDRGRIRGVAVSPDGGAIAVVRNVSDVFGVSTHDIVLLRLDDMETETPIATGPADQRFPAFSPDGRWIAYSSDESGRFEIHVRQVGETGAQQQISTGGGLQPAWSGDGSQLFYWSADRLVTVDISEPTPGRLSVGPERTFYQGETFMGAGRAVTRTYDVSPDGRRIVVARPVGDRGEVNLWLDWMHELEPLLGEPDGEN
jgi:hypothetical protein